MCMHNEPGDDPCEFCAAIPIRTECCLTPINQEHASCCDANASIDKVTESMKRDSERWDEGYIDRSTSAVRRKVLAHSNGHVH